MIQSVMLDDEGDLDLSTGTLRLTPDLATYTEQALRTTLSVFLGEWFLDARIGMPLFRDIIGQRFDAGLVRAVYRRAAERTTGVGSVESVQVEFDNATRTLSVTELAYTTSDGDVVEATPFRVGL